MIVLSKKRLSVLLASLCLSGIAHATDVTGAGSSFVYPVLAKWSQDYSKVSSNRINYQSIGSGGGIAQIKAATVDFGASDAPLSADELKAAGLGQFPSVIGGIVPVMNIEGIAAGQLKLDGENLAKIFLGEITTWNDPAIAALNPGLKLPSGKITVVHRSDGSGTSYNFTNYLTKASDAWKSKIGLRHHRALAGGCWRQGQRRGFGLREADQELDRLCRVRLRPAEQDDPRPVEKPPPASSSSLTPRRSRPLPIPPTGPTPRIST
nr:phosphate ABC transporter substrate-binding protein PstS [Pseudomonas fuscovaginae]